jgi:hypothetical protein
MFGAALLPGVTVGEALGIEGYGIRLQSHADPAQTIRKPSPSLRSGGGGHDGCCLRLEYDHGVAELDRPSPTLKAGGNYEADGKQGGGCPPVVAYRWSDAMLAKHPPASPASPASTIRASMSKGGATGGLVWVDEAKRLVRRFHIEEMMTLQSIDRWAFVWPAGIGVTHQFKVCGNGWACGMAAAMSRALAVADPKSRTVIDLFCGGGLGASGWHGRYWTYEEGGAA